MTPTGPQKVFISYRRRDSAGHAGRLYDAMADQFDEHNVFMDVDMAPGVDFVERITQAVGSCHVLLVVIGPRWVDLLNDDDGGVRSQEAEDFVRLEVETALRRPDVTVIPVLVAGAQMPEPETLPEGLRPLARRNALELSDMRWRFDVQRLSARLHDLLGGTTDVHHATEQPIPEGETRNRRGFQFLLEGLAVAVVAGLAARGLNLALRTPPEASASDVAKIVDGAVWRGENWSLVGAALAVWLTFMRGERDKVVVRGFLGLVMGILAGGLGGATYAALRNLPTTEPTLETVHVYSTLSFAVTGAILGVLIGGLWLPRRPGSGLIVGLVAGALVHAAYNNRGFSAISDGEKVLSTCMENFVIVGSVLAALIALDALRTGSQERAGPPRASTGYG